MTPNNQRVFLIVMLCGISLHAVLGQLDWFHSFSKGNKGTRTPVTSTQRTEVGQNNGGDDDDDDVMNRLGQVESVKEFMALLRINGRAVTEEDIFDRDDGKQYISGGGRMAIPDTCSPRNVTIRIKMEGETDSDIAYFPRCTKIERCGGCTSDPNLACVPRYTERISLKVLKGRVPYPGAAHLEFTGFANVIVDRHMTCKVSCKLNAQSCGPLKTFDGRRCSCKCTATSVCPPPLVWDSENCSCACGNVIQCCEDKSSDDCGMVWNTKTCQCDLTDDGRIHISAGAAKTIAESAGTTTAPASTGQPDPCLRFTCPGRLRKVRKGTVCRCSFSFFRKG